MLYVGIAPRELTDKDIVPMPQEDKARVREKYENNGVTNFLGTNLTYLIHPSQVVDPESLPVG